MFTLFTPFRLWSNPFTWFNLFNISSHLKLSGFTKPYFKPHFVSQSSQVQRSHKRPCLCPHAGREALHPWARHYERRMEWEGGFPRGSSFKVQSQNKPREDVVATGNLRASVWRRTRLAGRGERQSVAWRNNKQSDLFAGDCWALGSGVINTQRRGNPEANPVHRKTQKDRDW